MDEAGPRTGGAAVLGQRQKMRRVPADRSGQPAAPALARAPRVDVRKLSPPKVVELALAKGRCYPLEGSM
eukprot:SAG11_NODE_368_length_10082_cov_299.189622_7_plen_70_part_00